MKAWLVTRERTAKREPRIARPLVIFRSLLQDCWLCMIACITTWSPWSSFDDHRSVFTLSREIPIVLWLTIIGGKTSQCAFAHECQILKFTIQHTSREKLKINCRCDHHFRKIILRKYVCVLYHMRIIKCMVFKNFQFGRLTSWPL